MTTTVDINIKPIDANYVELEVASPELENTVFKAFQFSYPGYQHDPKYKMGLWDGKVALFTKSKRRLLRGLVDRLSELGKKHVFTISNPNKVTPINRADLEAETARMGFPYALDNEQHNAIQLAVENKRSLIIAPTGFGKTAMCYAYARYHINRGKRVLIVVPEVYLARQFFNDCRDKFGDPQDFHFKENGWKHTDPVERSAVVVTQKSIYLKPESWFKQFDVFIGDEAHRYQAKTYLELAMKMGHIEDRLGCTGSMPEEKYSQAIVEGIFAKPYVAATAQLQISKGRQAKPTIHAIRLEYGPEIKKFWTQTNRRPEYVDEIKYLCAHNGRNEFISKLASKLDGNTLVLFRFINHGKELQKRIEGRTGQCHLVFGKIDVDEREAIVDLVKNSTQSHSVCSYKTFGTGVDIPNLNNVVKASPLKSRTTNMQGDGRGVRATEYKTEANIFDIYDNLVNEGDRPNYSLQHFQNRLKIYKEQEYDVIYHTYFIGI